MGNEFAGVDLSSYEPPAGGSQVSEPRGEDSGASQSQAPGAADSSNGAPSIVDLDKLERFRFGGRELTPKELERERLRYADYTRKMQEVSEARKYADNFHADLRAVIERPDLLVKMKEVYPAEYVALAEQVLGTLGQRGSSNTAESGNQNGNQQQGLPPELSQALAEIRDWKQQTHEQAVTSSLELIDSLHERMSKKYPFADPDVVDRRIELAIEKGMKVDKTNIAKVYEHAYKHRHEEQKSRYDALNKTKVEEQVKSGKAARDIGAGGSVPGMAPRKFNSFKEINQAALASIGK